MVFFRVVQKLDVNGTPPLCLQYALLYLEQKLVLITNQILFHKLLSVPSNKRWSRKSKVEEGPIKVVLWPKNAV